LVRRAESTSLSSPKILFPPLTLVRQISKFAMLFQKSILSRFLNLVCLTNHKSIAHPSGTWLAMRSLNFQMKRLTSLLAIRRRLKRSANLSSLLILKISGPPTLRVSISVGTIKATYHLAMKGLNSVRRKGCPASSFFRILLLGSSTCLRIS